MYHHIDVIYIVILQVFCSFSQLRKCVEMIVGVSNVPLHSAVWKSLSCD